MICSPTLGYKISEYSLDYSFISFISLICVTMKCSTVASQSHRNVPTQSPMPVPPNLSLFPAPLLFALHGSAEYIRPAPGARP